MMYEITKLVQVTDLRPLGLTDQSDISRTIDTLYNYGILTQLIPPERIFTNEFWLRAQSGNTE
jgi:hypothetical protein